MRDQIFSLIFLFFLFAHNIGFAGGAIYLIPEELLFLTYDLSSSKDAANLGVATVGF